MKHVGIDLKLTTIQAIRVLMAVLESDFIVHVPEHYRTILAHLDTYFDLRYVIGLDDVPVVKVEIDHARPNCKIGEIERPLIYSHAAFRWCRRVWNKRTIESLFIGHMTEHRARVLRGWSFMNPVIVASERGRTFPIKAWDEDYYRGMGRAKFVLCPDGDYVWTYRFFEAVMCGCIPVVEHETALYNDLIHYSGQAVYDERVVEENFQRAERLLTIPLSELNEQLARAT